MYIANTTWRSCRVRAKHNFDMRQFADCQRRSVVHTYLNITATTTMVWRIDKAPYWAGGGDVETCAEVLVGRLGGGGDNESRCKCRR